MGLSRLVGGWIAVVVWLLLWELVASRLGSARGDGKLRRVAGLSGRGPAPHPVRRPLVREPGRGRSGGWCSAWSARCVNGRARGAGGRPSVRTRSPSASRCCAWYGRWWRADCWPGGSRRHDGRRDRAPGALLRHRADPAGTARAPRRWDATDRGRRRRSPSACAGSWQRGFGPTARSPAARSPTIWRVHELLDLGEPEDSPAVGRPHRLAARPAGSSGVVPRRLRSGAPRAAALPALPRRILRPRAPGPAARAR